MNVSQLYSATCGVCGWVAWAEYPPGGAAVRPLVRRPEAVTYACPRCDRRYVLLAGCPRGMRGGG